MDLYLHYGDQVYKPIFPAPKKTNPVPNRVRVLAGPPDLLPPMTARQKKRRGRARTQTKEKKKRQNPPRPPYSPNSIPSSAWAGPPSSVAVTSASPLPLPLGVRVLALGCLRGLGPGPFLPALTRGGSPPPRELSGLLLGCTGISPRPMTALAIGAPGSRM